MSDARLVTYVGIIRDIPLDTVEIWAGFTCGFYMYEYECMSRYVEFAAAAAVTAAAAVLLADRCCCRSPLLLLLAAAAARCCSVLLFDALSDSLCFCEQCLLPYIVPPLSSLSSCSMLSACCLNLLAC